MDGANEFSLKAQRDMLVQYNVFYKNSQPANSGILLENKSNKCIHKPNHFCRESVAFVTFIRACVV